MVAACAAALVALAAPSGSSPSALVDTPCPVTAPNGATPEGAPQSPTNHGDGTLMAALWFRGVVSDPDSVAPDGSISLKLGWWRGTPGRLMISGERLDAPAPPMAGGTAPPDAYPPTGFIPSGLDFPTRGCWQVSGRLGGDEVSFVVQITVGRDVRPTPSARLLTPLVRPSAVHLRWRSSVVDGARFDIALRRVAGPWRLLERQLPGRSYTLRVRRAGRYEARIRPHDAFGAGDWSASRRFAISSTN